MHLTKKALEEICQALPIDGRVMQVKEFRDDIALARSEAPEGSDLEFVTHAPVSAVDSDDRGHREAAPSQIPLLQPSIVTRNLR